MQINIKEPPADHKTPASSGFPKRKEVLGGKDESKEASTLLEPSEEEDADSQRAIWRIMAVVALILYFVYRHVWEGKNQFPNVIVLSFVVEISLLMMAFYPKWKSNDLHRVLGDSSVQWMLIVLMTTMIFDICGIFQNMFGNVIVLIFFARVSRAALYYILVTNFEASVAERKRNELKEEIEEIQMETDLGNIFKKLEEYSEGQDEVLRAAVLKGKQLHNEKKRRVMSRKGLTKKSFMDEKADIDPLKIHEVKIKEIDSYVNTIETLPERIFDEDLDFTTMDDQYNLKMILDSCQDLEFDVFDLQTKSDGNELYVLGMHIMNKDTYMEEFKIDKRKLQKFLFSVQNSYNPVAYHNQTHATDLTQTLYYFMHSCDVRDICKLTRMEEMTMLLAGFMHDIDHPGFSNSFLINTAAPLAIRYNDKSVLENYHVAMGFKIMKGNEQCDIFENLSMRKNRDIRKQMVELILGTDMAHHFQKMYSLHDRVSQDDFEPAGKDKKMATEFLFHMADISNTSKPWPVCKKWIDMLFIEFFNQGDKEKELGLQVSYLMDRTTVNVAESQDGFINKIVKPGFTILQKFVPDLSQNLNYLEGNIEKWAKKVPQYSVGTHSHMETKKEREEPKEVKVTKEVKPVKQSKMSKQISEEIEVIIEEEEEQENQPQEETKQEEEEISYVPSEYSPHLSSRLDTDLKEMKVRWLHLYLDLSASKIIGNPCFQTIK